MKVYRNCLVLLVVIMTSACSDWLTVNPKNQKQEDDLFSTGTGYRTALNGIYQQLSEGTVYGREMTWECYRSELRMGWIEINRLQRCWGIRVWDCRLFGNY